MPAVAERVDLDLRRDLIRPLPSQERFLDEMWQHKYLLFGGAAGSGQVARPPLVARRLPHLLGHGARRPQRPRGALLRNCSNAQGPPYRQIQRRARQPLGASNGRGVGAGPARAGVPGLAGRAKGDAGRGPRLLPEQRPRERIHCASQPRRRLQVRVLGVRGDRGGRADQEQARDVRPGALPAALARHRAHAVPGRLEPRQHRPRLGEAALDRPRLHGRQRAHRPRGGRLHPCSRRRERAPD